MSDLVLHEKIDRLEKAMLANLPLVDFPVEHLFTNGLYVRTVFNPAGSLLTTKIHKTEHPFAILKGSVSVYVPGVGTEHLEAPHIGVTKPGTRRVIYAHEDTVWVTFHPNPDDETDLDKLEERLIERRELENGKTSHEIHQALMAERSTSALSEGEAR